MFVNGSGFYRGPSKDASYQASDKLALWFQRKDGKSSHCLWQGELKRQMFWEYFSVNGFTLHPIASVQEHNQVKYYMGVSHSSNIRQE